MRDWKKAWSVEEKNGRFIAYDSLGNPYDFTNEEDAYHFLDDMDSEYGKELEEDENS